MHQLWVPSPFHSDLSNSSIQKPNPIFTTIPSQYLQSTLPKHPQHSSPLTYNFFLPAQSSLNKTNKMAPKTPSKGAADRPYSLSDAELMVSLHVLKLLATNTDSKVRSREPDFPRSC